MVELTGIIEQLSKLNSNVQESSNVNLVLLIISIIIASVAVYGTFIQSSHLKRDLTTRIRPVLTRVGFYFPKTFNPKDSRVGFEFQNTGSIPAVNISFTWYVGIKTNDQLTELKTSDKKNPDGIFAAPMAPSEKYLLGFEIDHIHFNEVSSSGQCVFGMSITYHDPSGKPYLYKMEGRLSGSNILLSNSSKMT